MPDFSYRQHVFFNTSSCRASIAMWHCARVCHSNCYRYEMRFQIGADFTKDASSVSCESAPASSGIAFGVYESRFLYRATPKAFLVLLTLFCFR